MTVEHHDLLPEFPEYKSQIHELKVNDHHFRRLFDGYHELTIDIEKMENEITPVATLTEEEAKMRRVHLKDELFTMIKKAAAS
jgi:uncharacterized protein YdcH (DUF465 family)